MAWYYDDIPGQIVGYLVAFVIMVVGAGIVSLLNDFGLHGLEYWQIWLVIIISSYLMSSPLDAKMMAAGADWLQWGRRKRWYQRYPRTGFIQTYDLIRITADSSGVNAPYLYLEDSESNRLYRMRHDLQKDRRIWDLLYNGILHSVANGAEINAMSIELLELDRTPALSLRDRGRPTDEKA